MSRLLKKSDNSNKLLNPFFSRDLTIYEIDILKIDIFQNNYIIQSHRMLLNGVVYSAESNSSYSKFILYQFDNHHFGKIHYFIKHLDIFAYVQIYNVLKRSLFSDIRGRPSSKSIPLLRDLDAFDNYFYFIEATNKFTFISTSNILHVMLYLIIIYLV